MMTSAVAFPRFGPLTQGTIFGCAVAEDYDECQIYGLIITARCDVANDKARSYNYVPVVSLRDWLHRDGRILLGERLRSEALGGMKAVIKDAGFSPSILDTEPHRSVLSNLFPVSDTSARNSKFRQRFDDYCARCELATGAIDDDQSGTCGALADSAPKIRAGLIAEITSHRLAGHYFLEQVEPDGQDIGYVALQRQVQFIPRSLAHAVGIGLDVRSFEQMCQADPALKGRLRIVPNDLAMPVGLVSSPNIEHFMQSFSSLFGRIGIPECSKSYVAELWSRQQVQGVE